MPNTTAVNSSGPPVGSTGDLRTASIVGPPKGNTVGLPRRGFFSPRIGRGGIASSPRKSTVKAPPVNNKDLASLKRQQTETKKQKSSKTNDKSTTKKKPKASKPRPANVRDVKHDKNDVRFKDPKDWDEVTKIQQVFEAVVRSFALVTARPPPLASPWCSYQHQRAVFQQASDYYWRLEKRPGPSPELADIGPWHGTVNSIINAPVEITEEDLGYATHPSVALYQPVPGSIAWLESNQNLEHVLENQLEPNAYAQPSRRFQGLRTSSSQPKSFLVNSKAAREQVVAPYRLGALVASRIKGSIATNGSQSMSPMQHNEPGKLTLPTMK